MLLVVEVSFVGLGGELFKLGPDRNALAVWAIVLYIRDFSIKATGSGY